MFRPLGFCFFIINKSSKLVAGEEAPHTIAEGLNIFQYLYFNFTLLNDSGISFFYNLVCDSIVLCLQ